MFDALLIGLAAGYAIAIPVGPIALLIIRTAMHGGLRPGLAAGAGTATVSSLNTDFTSGFYYDKFVNKASDGSFQSLGRQVMGGNGNQTIIGTIHTTAKKFDL